jgi:hypothetical protein
VLLLHVAAQILLALTILGCSSSRGGGGVAPAVALGWVDFTLSDDEVPADPIARLAGSPDQPPVCTLDVDFDGLPVLSERLLPVGSSPPYTIDSTFRFSALPGEHAATVSYSGCRTVDGQLDSVHAEIRIPVRSRQVTRLRFDGSRLDVKFPSGGPAALAPR